MLATVRTTVVTELSLCVMPMLLRFYGSHASCRLAQHLHLTCFSSRNLGTDPEVFKHFNMNPRGAFLLNEPARPHRTKAVRMSFGPNLQTTSLLKY